MYIWVNMQLPEDQYEGYPGCSFSAEFPAIPWTESCRPALGPQHLPLSQGQPAPCPHRSWAVPTAQHMFIFISVWESRGFFFLFFQKISLGNGKKVWSVIQRIQPDEPTICASYWCCKKLPQKRKSKNQDVCREAWLLLGAPGENLSLASSSFQTPLVPSV